MVIDNTGARGRVIKIGRKYVTVKYGPLMMQGFREYPSSITIINNK
jgi:hypothetical protein